MDDTDTNYEVQRVQRVDARLDFVTYKAELFIWLSNGLAQNVEILKPVLYCI